MASKQKPAFALGRVKAIAQESSNIGNLSESSLLALTHSAELFLVNMSKMTSNIALKAKDTTIKKEHIMSVCESDEGAWVKEFVDLESAKEPSIKKRKRGAKVETQSMSDIKLASLPQDDEADVLSKKDETPERETMYVNDNPPEDDDYDDE